ncbi:MAG TPA: toll/interleukin-1 receptor domain-containing protein, partial [Naasia sp.]
MADIAISYAHADADAAQELRTLLVAAGHEVWMDDPGNDDVGQDVGIPVGREHWEVIRREFATAHLVIGVATAAWRRSAYCEREREF